MDQIECLATHVRYGDTFRMENNPNRAVGAIGLSGPSFLYDISAPERGAPFSRPASRNTGSHHFEESSVSDRLNRSALARSRVTVRSRGFLELSAA